MSTLFISVGIAVPTMTRADEERPTIIAVAACDSFAEIREQCAWIGGLVGFPMLGGQFPTILCINKGSP